MGVYRDTAPSDPKAQGNAVAAFAVTRSECAAASAFPLSHADLWDAPLHTHAPTHAFALPRHHKVNWDHSLRYSVRKLRGNAVDEEGGSCSSEFEPMSDPSS